MSSPILKISKLNVMFPGLMRDAHVLRDVHLTVKQGDVVGLVGESGSGKSMTASACLGLIPNRGRATGSIVLDGQEIIGRPEAELANIRGGIAAMVFQNPMRSLNPFYSIGQQMVEIIRRHRKLGARDARVAAIDELQTVQMPDPEIAFSKYPHQMSGGQIQRVMIAIALACRPRLLIADEPTTALDVTVQAQIISLVRGLADRTGLTVLFITHDLGVVSTLCNRVAVMYAGRIVETGDVGSVINSPAHPYTQRLLKTVPIVGASSSNLETIPGQVPGPTAIPLGCAFRSRCNRATEICSTVDPQLKSVANDLMVACHNHGSAKSMGKQIA